MAKGPAAPFFCTLSRDAARVEAAAGLPRPHTTLTKNGATPPLLPRRLPRRAARPRPGIGFGDRDVAALQPGHPLSQLRRRAAARAIPGMDRGLDQGRGARAVEADGLALPERRRQADRPWTALDVAQAARGHLTLQNTIHWIKSIAIDREAAGAGAGARPRPRRRPLQADQQRPLRQRLPRVHLPLHARRPDAARPPRDRRAVSGRVERRALARPAAATAAAAATPGSSPTRRSRAATRTARTRRPFRRASPEYCLRLHGRVAAEARRWIRSSDSAAPRSPARDLGVDFVGIEIDEHYLREAVARVKRMQRVGPGRSIARSLGRSENASDHNRCDCDLRAFRTTERPRPSDSRQR